MAFSTILVILFGVGLTAYILLLAVRTWLPHPKLRPLFCRIGWHSRQRDRRHLATSATTGRRYVQCGWCDHQGYETHFGDMG